MVASISGAASGRPIMVYCWRGGLRSKTVASILDLTGYEAVQLKGGYKSFRHHVMESFSPFIPPGPLVVIHGMTGIGKTAFLLGMKSENFTVIDLEGLASHRGSAFGELGITQGLVRRNTSIPFSGMPSANAHLENLWLLKEKAGESGRYPSPGELYDVMLRSSKIWCDASMETRVRRLIGEYGRHDYRECMEEALNRIKEKARARKSTEISGYLKRWELEPFTEELIRHYYDKVYYKVKEWREDAVISLEDFPSGGV